MLKLALIFTAVVALLVIVIVVVLLNTTARTVRVTGYHGPYFILPHYLIYANGHEKYLGVDVDGMVEDATAIARVRLISVTADDVERRLKYTFQVMEYLKGDGDTRLEGFVGVDHDPEDLEGMTGSEITQRMLSLRDSRWDDREGLLFQGLYYRMDDNFGYMSPINGQGGITLSNFLIKTLLPMVGDEAHNANIPQGQRMYYLEDPSREPYEGSQFTVVSEELKRTISLAEIKVKIAALAGP